MTKKYPERNKYWINPVRMIQELQQAGKVTPKFPQAVHRYKPFNLYDAVVTIRPELEDYRDMIVKEEEQIECFENFLNNPLEPRTILIGSKYEPAMATQLASYLSMYWTLTCTVYTVKDLDYPAFGRNKINRLSEWIPVLSGYRDYLGDKFNDPMRSTAFPVFYNITDNSAHQNYDKLRDGITCWDSVPKVIVYSGELDPVTFNMLKVHADITDFIWLDSRKKVRVNI